MISFSNSLALPVVIVSLVLIISHVLSFNFYHLFPYLCCSQYWCCCCFSRKAEVITGSLHIPATSPICFFILCFCSVIYKYFLFLSKIDVLDLVLSLTKDMAAVILLLWIFRAPSILGHSFLLPHSLRPFLLPPSLLPLCLYLGLCLFLCLCVSLYVGIPAHICHSVHLDVRELRAVGSLLPCGLQGSNSGHQAWHKHLCPFG